jgi:hypothetical protein
MAYRYSPQQSWQYYYGGWQAGYNHVHVEDFTHYIFSWHNAQYILEGTGVFYTWEP